MFKIIACQWEGVAWQEYGGVTEFPLIVFEPRTISVPL